MPLASRNRRYYKASICASRAGSPDDFNIAGAITAGTPMTTCSPTNTGPCGVTTNSDGQILFDHKSMCSVLCISGSTCIVPSPTKTSMVLQTWHENGHPLAVVQDTFHCNTVLANGQ